MRETERHGAYSCQYLFFPLAGSFRSARSEDLPTMVRQSLKDLEASAEVRRESTPAGKRTKRLVALRLKPSTLVFPSCSAPSCETLRPPRPLGIR